MFHVDSIALLCDGEEALIVDGTSHFACSHDSNGKRTGCELVFGVQPEVHSDRSEAFSDAVIRLRSSAQAAGWHFVLMGRRGRVALCPACSATAMRLRLLMVGAS